MTYSGRCLLSNYMAERGANQGSCAHSCRWKYSLKVQHQDGSEGTIEINDKNMGDFNFFLEEEFRKGVLYPIEEDEHGSYILNARDLNLMPKIADYLKLGIDSLKVEGRNKSEYYVAVVTRAYRAAIDSYYADPENFESAPFIAELSTVPSRGYTTGFHTGRLENTGHDYDSGISLSAFEYGGLVREWQGDDLIVEVKNRLLPGDVLEFLPPGRTDCIRLRVYQFENAANRKKTEKIAAGEGRAMRIRPDVFANEDIELLKQQIVVGTVVRKARALTESQNAALQQNMRAQEVELELLPKSSLLRNPEERTQARSALKRQKAPKLGAEGCCALGCNGCLPFWNEPQYERARCKLSEKKGLKKLEVTAD
jgi:putative protease